MCGSNFTAADYAWHNANEAMRETSSLETRVTALEKQIATMNSKLYTLEHKISSANTIRYMAALSEKGK